MFRRVIAPSSGSSRSSASSRRRSLAAIARAEARRAPAVPSRARLVAVWVVLSDRPDTVSRAAAASRRAPDATLLERMGGRSSSLPGGAAPSP